MGHWLQSLAMAGGTAGALGTALGTAPALLPQRPGPSSQNSFHLPEGTWPLIPSLPEVLGSLSPLLLLPAAHYHQSQPEVGLYINSTSIMLVASPHAPPAARDRHTQGSRSPQGAVTLSVPLISHGEGGPEGLGHPAAQKQGQRLHWVQQKSPQGLSSCCPFC